MPELSFEWSHWPVTGQEYWLLGSDGITVARLAHQGYYDFWYLQLRNSQNTWQNILRYDFLTEDIMNQIKEAFNGV